MSGLSPPSTPAPKLKQQYAATTTKKKKNTTFSDEVMSTPLPSYTMTPVSTGSRPTPEQFVFDQHLFSERKKNNYSTPRCPSPPLKSTPASRNISFNSNQPFIHHMSSEKPLLIPQSNESDNDSSNQNSNSNVESLFDLNFEIVSRLGSGSFSDVYKSYSKQDGLLYAVKQARHVFRGYQERDRAVQEIKNATLLKPHPNIMQYYNSWEQSGILYIQSELCERGTLKDLLEFSPVLHEDLIWNFLVDCLLGVKHIHQGSMLHLDIKPENLLISSSGSLKIGDFGMAVQLQQQQNVNGNGNSDVEPLDLMNTSRDSNNLSIDEDDVYFDFIEGDSRYLAIEFLNDKKLIGMPSDIFSIGVTFFEMVTGKEMPSNGPLWEQLREDRAFEFLEANKYSDMLYQCILAMMKSDIHERITLDQLFKIDKIHNIIKDRIENPNINRTINLIPQSPKLSLLEKETQYSSPMASLSLKSSAHFIQFHNNNNSITSSNGGTLNSSASSNNINSLFNEQLIQQQEQMNLEKQKLQQQQQQPPPAPKSVIKSMKRVLQDSIDGTNSQKVCAIRRSLDNSLQSEDSTMSPRNLLSLFQDTKN